MTAKIIDGAALAAKLRAQIKEAAARLKEERGVVPGLAVVRVGDDPASEVYVGMKKKAAVEAGFHSWEHHLDATLTQAELLALVRGLNGDPAVHGILVQLPLPAALNPDE